MINHILNISNRMCYTGGAGAAHPSGVPELIPSFCGIRITQSIVFCCGPLLVCAS